MYVSHAATALTQTLKDSGKQIASYFCYVNELNALLNASKCKFFAQEKLVFWFIVLSFFLRLVHSYIYFIFLCPFFGSLIHLAFAKKIHIRIEQFKSHISMDAIDVVAAICFAITTQRHLFNVWLCAMNMDTLFWSRVSALGCVCVCLSAKSAGMLCTPSSVL